MEEDDKGEASNKAGHKQPVRKKRNPFRPNILLPPSKKLTSIIPGAFNPNKQYGVINLQGITEKRAVENRSVPSHNLVQQFKTQKPHKGDKSKKQKGAKDVKYGTYPSKPIVCNYCDCKVMPHDFRRHIELVHGEKEPSMVQYFLKRNSVVNTEPVNKEVAADSEIYPNLTNLKTYFETARFGDPHQPKHSENVLNVPSASTKAGHKQPVRKKRNPFRPNILLPPSKKLTSIIPGAFNPNKQYGAINLQGIIHHVAENRAVENRSVPSHNLVQQFKTQNPIIIQPTVPTDTPRHKSERKAEPISVKNWHSDEIPEDANKVITEFLTKREKKSVPTVSTINLVHKKRAVENRSTPFDAPAEYLDAHRVEEERLVTERSHTDPSPPVAVKETKSVLSYSNETGHKQPVRKKRNPSAYRPNIPLPQHIKKKKTRTVPADYNPNKHCGVINKKGEPCLRNLQCILHRVAEKRAVENRTVPFDALVQQFKAQKPVIIQPTVPTDTPRRKSERKSEPISLKVTNHVKPSGKVHKILMEFLAKSKKKLNTQVVDTLPIHPVARTDCRVETRILSVPPVFTINPVPKKRTIDSRSIPFDALAGQLEAHSPPGAVKELQAVICAESVPSVSIETPSTNQFASLNDFDTDATFEKNEPLIPVTLSGSLLPWSKDPTLSSLPEIVANKPNPHVPSVLNESPKTEEDED